MFNPIVTNPWCRKYWIFLSRNNIWYFLTNIKDWTDFLFLPDYWLLGVISFLKTGCAVQRCLLKYLSNVTKLGIRALRNHNTHSKYHCHLNHQFLCFKHIKQNLRERLNKFCGMSGFASSWKNISSSFLPFVKSIYHVDLIWKLKYR